ncbi:MAG: hypothetical protein EXS36_07465 [Pedosphaera sp.]|nr:hypothetical protein [Pedosphaera sp.]
MSLLGNLMAVGRTIAGVSQKPEYRIHRGSAVPGINLASPRGFGNGLCDRVKQDILRRTAPKPVRERNPFAANSKEPRSLQGVAPALAGGRSRPTDGEILLARTPEIPMTDVEAAPVPGLNSGPGRMAVESVAVEMPWAAGKIRWGWLAWITGLRPGSRVRGTGRPLVQEELRLNDVRPLRSRLMEPATEGTSPSSATRTVGWFANPFSVRAGRGANGVKDSSARANSTEAEAPSGSAPARSKADRFPAWLRRRDPKPSEEFLEA